MEYWQPTPYKLCSAWIFFVTLDFLYVAVESSLKDEVDKHLSMGGQMLARGQLQDALSHYHAAVDGDPKNYLTYFKRGTVYLALGKANMALPDFNKALELNNDFQGARYHRAQILLKQAKLEDAREDLAFLLPYGSFPDVFDLHSKTFSLGEEISLSEAYIRGGDYAAAVELLSHIIEVCPWSSRLRELRSQCYVALNDPMSAVMDLRSTTKLSADNTHGYYKLTMLLYQLGLPHDSLKEVRECLKLDPEHKDCFPHYKKVKKVVQLLDSAQEAKDSSDWEGCAAAANKMLKVEDKVNMIKYLAKEKLCQCLLHMDQISSTLDACTEALAISKSPDLLCDRAEAYIESEMYDQALRDYQEALELNDNLHRAKEGLQRTQKLQKQSEKRDYYKILGVKRSATKQEITKAYRKMAQKWHPDNFPSGGEESKIAQKKFIDIAAAKEVLTDPEKRRKFDQGEDPLDPESGQHQGFNPFQQFHQFHSGGPFTFKFHFN